MIGKVIKSAVKLVAREIATTASQNAGTEIGKALGRLVADRINPPQTEEKKP